MKQQAKHWVILVSGYGCFLFAGTRAKAEEMRAHKANWEGGIGVLRPATMSEANGTSELSDCWNHPLFEHRARYACDCSKCCGEAVNAAQGEKRE